MHNFFLILLSLNFNYAFKCINLQMHYLMNRNGMLSSLQLRATSHMSQEPRPCNGEDPWLSSKVHTMGVGKSRYRQSRILKHNVKWEWTMLRDHCMFCWREKEGRIWFNIICLKLYQFERTTRWCLSVMESALKFVMLKKIMVSRNLRQAHLLEVDMT